MKKILLVLVAVIGLTSCESESKKVDCNCGLVTSDNVEDYSVVIRNNCTDNSQKFILTPGDWFNAHPGDDYCITNVDKW